MASKSAKSGGLRVRLALWRAASGPVASGFTFTPEPRSIGRVAKGRQLLAGNYLFAGHLVEAADRSIWDVAPPDPEYEEELHGFIWLDDLAAVGDGAAREMAQAWTQTWITRFGTGKGRAWAPDTTGRRLIRWLHHALFVLAGGDRASSLAMYKSLTAQTRYLARHWHHAPPGLPRFEALTGLVYAGLSLMGMEQTVPAAIDALAREAEREVDAEGGISSRNPEELLEIFTLLTWAAQTLTEAERPVPEGITEAMQRIAPTLRLMRHADGGLARFHGGGRGLEGRLDRALASAGVKSGAVKGRAMGYVRLSGGRTSVILDAADPPGGDAGRAAHASTLAFELTSGRRPMIVSCGNGAPFGPDWRRAGRATPSHSTLSIEGISSSRIAGGGEALTDRAHVLTLREIATEIGHGLHIAHDGWAKTHGLTHARDIAMSSDGRHLAGQDTLIALNPKGKARFQQVLTETAMRGVAFTIRFHLHPEADASLDMGGTAVSVALPSGEIWVFRFEGNATLSIDPSVYLEKGRLQPRPSRQIILSGLATDVETRIGWTLAKAQDTPTAIRDIARDDDAANP